MQLTIRRAKVDDLSAMYVISLRAHQLLYATLIPPDRRFDFDRRYTSSKESSEAYISRMVARSKRPDWHMWVAESGGKIVGYTLEKRERATFIQNRGLFVDPDYHGRGVGTKLFETSLKIAKLGDVIRLSVVKNNLRAKHLYEKHGFVVLGQDSKTFFGATQEIMERTVD